MHLWPSLKLRDSFKLGYLNNLEWNIRRMNTQKNSNSESPATSNYEQQLLTEDTQNCNTNKNRLRNCVCTVLRDLLIICSCCYCCGACID